MKLYMVHVGYYDLDAGEGIYESHKNFFVVAKDPKDAKSKTFALEELFVPEKSSCGKLSALRKDVVSKI